MTEPATPAGLPLVQLTADEAVGYCDPETGTCALPGAGESATSHDTVAPVAVDDGHEHGA